MKILHVTEAYGGGVTIAINAYAEHSQQYRHFLFACLRVDDATGEESSGIFEDVKFAPRSIKALYILSKYIRDIQPDVIHLHSSYAGFFVRLLPWVSKDTLVYTPHAYSFLRKNNRFVSGAFYSIEWLLAKRTKIIAGCSRYEKILSEQFVSAEDALELINVCPQDLGQKNVAADGSEIVISMVGRVSEQKDFRFFADLASMCNLPVRFKWIGGGEPLDMALLENSGVSVTGWINRADVIAELARSDVYFHCAAWEGFPISVLEAANLGLPVMLRDIGPFSAEDLFTLPGIEQSAIEIKSYVVGDFSARQRAIANSIAISEYHCSNNLARSLECLYERMGDNKN